jgi:hypothetical protein
MKWDSKYVTNNVASEFVEPLRKHIIQINVQIDSLVALFIDNGLVNNLSEISIINKDSANNWKSFTFLCNHTA